ncbi:permease [Pedobacter sp. SD-b]|uniref:Permease n=1 Tax=Pedobacter segetis TaxID=2793069 RepID=A0ABS1BJY4_9SPHI|nr:permease [Pedobacter segetis]MBK0382524.1 permease [Pedobacter segetis]
MKTVENILIEFGKMGWSIFWGLSFGFILSAIIRAFISTKTISDKLGKNNPKSLGLATFFGGISSSCSYAAASMSRTLIIKGASWTNAIAFLIASTNLVFEIFIVIFTLLGTAFVFGEIAGGIIFILIAALLIVTFFPKKIKEEADKHIKEHKETGGHNHGGGEDVSKSSLKEKLKMASHHFYMDVKMVGKDILIGVAIAAILSVVVPKEFWTKVFLSDNQDLPKVVILLWNSVLGIIVAILSFVCSVGNIVLAAVLWHGGISFGGVFAFILSDLVTLPMLLVYRKYYGNKAMITLFIILSVSILATALMIDFGFDIMGLIPQNGTGTITDQTVFVWDYRTVLNIILIPTSVVFFFMGKREMKKMMK